MPNLGGPTLTEAQILFGRIQYLNKVSLTISWGTIPEELRVQLPFGKFDDLKVNVHDYIVYAYRWTLEDEECFDRAHFTETLCSVINQIILPQIEKQVAFDLKKEDEEKRKKEFDNRVQARMVDLDLSK